MNQDSDNLDYLTIDSIQWASGSDRPRMTKEDKRAKHRVHQRHFMMRQRERLERMRCEMRCHKLHLLRLQAAQEAALLRSENESLRQRILSDSLATEPRSVSVVQDASPVEPGHPQGDTDESFIFELLTLLPDIQSTNAEFEHVWSLPSCKDQDLAPQVWSPTTPCEIPVWSVPTEF